MTRGRRPHGHEFFGRGRMQGHGRVEIGLGRFHLDGDGEHLRHFGGAVADDMAADDAVGGGVDDELHQDPGVTARHRRLHRLEIGLVDVDVTELRARLAFRQSHGADLGLREHRGRNVGVVDLNRALAEHRIRERMTLADRDRRQVDAMGDVADRVDVRHRGAREVVDRDAAIARIDGDAGRFQSEIGDVRMPSDREHHLIGGNARTVGQMRGEFLAVPVDLVDGAAGENGDALLFHLGAHMGTDVVVETAQDVFAAIDHGHVGTEAGEDAGKFQRDVTAALNHDALRQRVQMKRLVRGDHVLDAGDGRPVIWRAAGRDQHIFCLHGLARRQPKRMRVLEHRARLDDAGAGFFHIGGVGCLEPRDLPVLVGDQGRPIERRGRQWSSRSPRRPRSRGGCASA